MTPQEVIDRLDRSKDKWELRWVSKKGQKGQK